MSRQKRYNTPDIAGCSWLMAVCTEWLGDGHFRKSISSNNRWLFSLHQHCASHQQTTLLFKAHTATSIHNALSIHWSLLAVSFKPRYFNERTRKCTHQQSSAPL